MTPQNFIIDGTVRTVIAAVQCLVQTFVLDLKACLVTAYSIPDAQHNKDQIYSGSDGCWSQLLDCPFTKFMLFAQSGATVFFGGWFHLIRTDVLDFSVGNSSLCAWYSM